MFAMKTFTALFTLVLTAALSLTAAAQEVAGTWQVESVSEIKPPKGASLTLSFAGEDKATVTYTLADQTQSWQYTYTVADGQLTLAPANPYGKPKAVTYDIKDKEGKLLLLTPKPKPVEEEAEEAEAAEGEEAAEAAETEEGAEKADEQAEEAPEEVETEEEDTRVAVWVLVKA